LEFFTFAAAESSTCSNSFRCTCPWRSNSKTNTQVFHVWSLLIATAFLHKTLNTENILYLRF